MEPRDVAPGPIIEPRWLDVDAAAQYLCMSRHAIYHRVNRCQIPFVRQGRSLRFDRQALAPRGTGNVVRMPRRARN
jgi:excisionase family DNA binding protein